MLSGRPARTNANENERKVSNMKVALKKLRCIEETDDSDVPLVPRSDEPYVIVVAVDLKLPIPQVGSVLYGPWKDIDDGDFAVTVPVPAGFDTDNFPFAVWRKPFWGLTGNSAPLTNPNDVIFLTAVMENDDGKANTARLAAQQATIA